MAAQETAADRPVAASRAVGAGRGLLYITAAKMWFMVGGSAIGFILPHLLRSKVSYGEWGFILSWVSPINNVMVTATIQTVAKFATQGADHVEGVKRAALKLQLVLGGVVALAYFLTAPTIAKFEHDPALIPGLRVSTGVVLCYAFYAVFVGAANGAREFHKQAALDATFTTLRAGGVFAGALLLSSVTGAVAGFAGAAALVLALSVWMVGVGPVDKPGSVRKQAAFMAPVAAYLLIVNMLMFVDGWVIKRLVAEAAARGGALAAGVTPERVASEALALYTAVQSVARIPYQAILSVTFVLFPLVSQATFAADHERTRTYIRSSTRLPLLVVLALASAVSARPDGLLNFFPAGYQAAAPALSVLAFGYVSFSLLSIAGTIMNGSGRTLATTVLGAITLSVDVALCWFGVRWALATGRDPLLWAAAATTTAMTLGLVGALVYLQLAYKASLPLLSLLRAALATAAALGVGRFVPLHGRIGGLVSCVACAATFVAVLALSRELTVGELRRLLQRSKPATG